MTLLEKIVREALNEDVAINRVYDAIKNTYEVAINYHSNGEDIATGERLIQPVAYGLTKSGNPVIRAFQPYGDTTTKTPSWKFFRIDRISNWEPYPNQKFPEPPDEYNAEGDFNENGDKTMSVVYSKANFDKTSDTFVEPNTVGPITKKQVQQKEEPKIFKTETEKGIERLRQQLQNPKYISDVVKLNNFGDKQTTTGPVTKNQLQQKEVPKIFKTDTEKRMERLKQQLENPQYIDRNPSTGPIVKDEENNDLENNNNE